MGTDEGPGAPAAGGGMQFDKVELASPEAARACARCKRAIADEYFEIAGHVLCRECGTELGGGQGGAGPWLRALALGGGAAAVATVAWYLLENAFQGSVWGFMAIGVGYLVGIAVRKGAGGRRGPSYQLLAMALTYASVTVSDLIPLLMASGSELGPANLLHLLGLALVAPFMAGVKNILGLFIIAIALYEAWKINRRIPVRGPFRLGPAAPLAVSPGLVSGAPPQSRP